MYVCYLGTDLNFFFLENCFKKKVQAVQACNQGYSWLLEFEDQMKK